MASIGKVVLLPKGTYNASATYNRLDFVVYNGSSWVSKIDNNTGNTPAEGNNWQLLAEAGTDGAVSGVPFGDDDEPSTSKLYSSYKVDQLLQNVVTDIPWGDDVAAATDKVYSSSKVSELISNNSALIDDTTASTSKVYSSNKVDALLGDYLKSSDASSTYLTQTDASSTYVKSADLKTVATTGNYSDLTGTPTIDSSLSDSSENAVQNKAVNTAISGLSTRVETLENADKLSADELTAVRKLIASGVTLTSASLSGTTLTLTSIS